MSLLLLSFLAGILTILAPCVLPLLPIIIGSGSMGSKNRPYIITASLAVSLFIFTLLIKISAIFVNLDPNFWKILSGSILILMGLIYLFPIVWDKISIKFNFSSSSDKLLSQVKQKNGFVGAVLTGAVLGPVFSSCSPTYAIALSTILQGNLYEGLINMISYILGLSLVMLLVTIFGHKIVKKLKFASNPNGLFKKVLGIIFLVIGVLIITGLDKKLELYVANNTFFDPAKLEQSLLQKNNSGTKNQTNGQVLNVNPAIKAPELVGISDWINSNPQTLSSLKGKVVLIDFWTYSCINCQRTIPYLNSLYKNYSDKGFVILGIHAPEFSFEKKLDNVIKGTKDFDIKYPVGLDNDFSTWKAYSNQFWPAKYLIDASGNIRYNHFGEGDYEQTELAIRELLSENGVKLDSSINSALNTANPVNNKFDNQTITPETYLGWSRSNKDFINSGELSGNENKTTNFKLNSNLDSNQWSLGKNWKIEPENIISELNQDGFESELNIRVKAQEVFLVAGLSGTTTESKNIQVQILDENNADKTSEWKGSDVSSNNKLIINSDKLYKIVKAPSNQTFKIRLITENGIRLNAFTFG